MQDLSRSDRERPGMTIVLWRRCILGADDTPDMIDVLDGDRLKEPAIDNHEVKYQVKI